MDPSENSPAERRHVQLPLGHSDRPDSIQLTNERIAEILEAEDIEYIRQFIGLPLPETHREGANRPPPASAVATTASNSVPSRKRRELLSGWKA